MTRGKVTVERVSGSLHVVIQMGADRYALPPDDADRLIDLLMQAVAIIRFDPAVPADRVSAGEDN